MPTMHSINLIVTFHWYDETLRESVSGSAGRAGAYRHVVGDGAAGANATRARARITAVGRDAGQRCGAVRRAQALGAASGVGVPLVLRNTLAYRMAVLNL